MTTQLILFDLIGTTIEDSSDGKSEIVRLFIESFDRYGVSVTEQEINVHRGTTKKQAITEILNLKRLSTHPADGIYSEFIDRLFGSIRGFSEIANASSLFRELRDRKIMIGLGSGLPMNIIDRLILNVGWRRDWFDYVGSSEDLGRSRPDPIMVYDAMAKTGIYRKQTIVKVGDTVVDILEGKNAGVATVAVLTGTQPRSELERHKPDFILNSIDDIYDLI